MSRKSNQTHVAKRNQTGQHSRGSAFMAPTTYHGSAIDRLWLYKLVYKRRHVSALFLVLILSFVLQPFDVSADDSLEQLSEPEVEISDEVINSLEDLVNTDTAEDAEDQVSEESVSTANEPDASAPVFESEDAVVASDLSVTESEVTIEDSDLITTTVDATATATTTNDTAVKKDNEDTLNLTVAGFDLAASSTQLLGSTTSSSTHGLPALTELSATTSPPSAEEPPPSTVSDEIDTGTTSTSSDSDGLDDLSQDPSLSEPDSSSESLDVRKESSSRDATATSTNSDYDDVEFEELPEDTGEYNPNLVSTVESDAAFTFDREECTRVDSGAYYCQSRSRVDVPSDALLALPDVDGDLEIFLTRNGEQMQLTSNTLDDSSPYYDDKSNTIVWHRLIGDRHQIMSYDLETGEETQITNSNENNMEPARHGKHIVWQRWIDDNWEIVLFDGRRELRVTESVEHDIAPNIRGSLIIWNAQHKNGDQELRTFDIESNTRDVIRDSEGVSVENPRMIVLYEALYENGDIVTRGFDLVSGKIISVGALPKQLPEELPESDSTGETRAIIQSKPSIKEDTVEVSIDSDLGFDDDTTLDLSTGSSTDGGNSPLEEDDFTLVIDSQATSSDLVEESQPQFTAATTSTSTQTTEN